jgi:DNA-binding HxlR family transcriptional regulator
MYILWKLLTRTYQFGEFKKEMPDITIKMLVQQLTKCEYLLWWSVRKTIRCSIG